MKIVYACGAEAYEQSLKEKEEEQSLNINWRKNKNHSEVPVFGEKNKENVDQ